MVKKITDEKRKLVQKLTLEGHNYPEIMDMVGVTKHQIRTAREKLPKKPTLRMRIEKYCQVRPTSINELSLLLTNDDEGTVEVRPVNVRRSVLLATDTLRLDTKSDVVFWIGE